jgi:hypothetical protein
MMTFADLKSFPEHLVQAVQLRQTAIKPPRPKPKPGARG